VPGDIVRRQLDQRAALGLRILPARGTMVDDGTVSRHGTAAIRAVFTPSSIDRARYPLGLAPARVPGLFAFASPGSSELHSVVHVAMALAAPIPVPLRRAVAWWRLSLLTCIAGKLGTAAL